MHRIWAGGPRQSLEESVHLPPVYRCFLTKLPLIGEHRLSVRGELGLGVIARIGPGLAGEYWIWSDPSAFLSDADNGRYSYLTILDPSSWEMPPGLSDTTCILSQSYCSAVEVFSPPCPPETGL